jgi:hypothetical protein
MFSYIIKVNNWKSVLDYWAKILNITNLPSSSGIRSNLEMNIDIERKQADTFEFGRLDYWHVVRCANVYRGYVRASTASNVRSSSL